MSSDEVLIKVPTSNAEVRRYEGGVSIKVKGMSEMEYITIMYSKGCVFEGREVKIDGGSHTPKESTIDFVYIEED